MLVKSLNEVSIVIGLLLDLNNECFDEFKGADGRSGIFPKPDKISRSNSVDLVHYRNLLATFIKIGLIDRNSV